MSNFCTVFLYCALKLYLMPTCLTPLRLSNQSIYHNDIVSFTSNIVPCGKCEACRQSHTDEWVNRLTTEFNYYEKHRGNVVFLTFTYKNRKLPRIRIVYNDKNGNRKFIVIPCFNANHLRQFLNLLHVRFYEKYKNDENYKYFICSEYGKHTKRPHYHALFFLSSGVDVSFFCLLVKRLWANKYGWMFPYIDKEKPWLVSKCLVRSRGKCAKYAAKYCCKDLAFYNIPELSSYLKDYFPKLSKDSDQYKYVKDRLPKHWISHGLGSSFLKDIDDNEKLKLFTDGYFNFFSQKYEPISRYVRNKLLFFYDKNKYPRISEKTGKPIYTRFMSDFFRSNYKVLYQCKVDNVLNNLVVPLLGDSVSSFQACLSSGYDYRVVRKLSSLIPDYAKDSFFYDLSNFHLVLSRVPIDYVYHELIRGTGDFLPWSTDFCCDCWLKNNDTIWLHDNFYERETLEDYAEYLTNDLNMSRFSDEYYLEYFSKFVREHFRDNIINLDEMFYFRLLLAFDDFLNHYQKWKSSCNTAATRQRLDACEIAMLSKCSYPIKYC